MGAMNLWSVTFELGAALLDIFSDTLVNADGLWRKGSRMHGACKKLA